MNKRKFLIIWSVTVGSMDALTGLLLVFTPALALTCLGVELPSTDALVFVSWIGAFVGGVGLSYGMALGERRRGRTVWQVTALLRTVIAVFVITRLAAHTLEWEWSAVALTDLVVAVVQIVLLRAGWWEEGHR